MNATLRFIEWGTLPIGATVGGLLVAPVGLRGVLWLAAAVCAVSILPALLSPIRSLKSNPTPETSEVGAP
jgi:predicted MFS family arabinose efflux permease